LNERVKNSGYISLQQLQGPSIDDSPLEIVERKGRGHPDSLCDGIAEEISYRLIRMFSIIGDVVLEPFLGTGTTTKVAKNLYRNSIGYEVDENLLPIIKKKIRAKEKPNVNYEPTIEFNKKR